MEPEETEEQDLGDWNRERREWEGETERSGWLVKHSGRAAAFADAFSDPIRNNGPNSS
jgi:hypothetical protein